MPHNRRPKPGSKYFLPKHEYLQVVHFCLSYNGLKQRLNALGGAPAIKYDGMPHGTTTGDPTGHDGALAASLRGKIHLIEDSVLECTGEALYEPMMAFITMENVTVEQIEAAYDLVMGRRQFSTLRRRIYWTIAQRL